MGDSNNVFEFPQKAPTWGLNVASTEDETHTEEYNTENYWSESAASLLALANGTYNGSHSEGNFSSSSSRRDENLAKVEMGVLALIFILTVVGNCVVLLGIFFRRQKMTRMYYFILHLSVADLITAFFNVLSQFFWEYTGGRFQGGNFLCKFVKYTQILGPYSSSYVLVMTALDRYQAICYPLSNCTWTAKRSKIMLGLAWAISLLSCIPQVFIFSYQLVKPATLTEPAEFDCWATFPENGAKIYVTWYSITVFIIPLIILVFAYSCITRAIWINFSMKAASRNQDNYERKMTRQDSDDMDGPSAESDSTYQNHRNGSNSIGNGTSHVLRQNTLNINIYNPSRRLFSKKGSTTSASGSVNFDENPSANKNVKNERNGIINQNPPLATALPSELRVSLSNVGKGAGVVVSAIPTTTHHQEQHDHEYDQLLPKAFVDENEFSSGICPVPDKYDLEDEEKKRRENINVNGNIKSNPDTCQHGCYRSRCNFCHLSLQHQDRRHSLDAPTGGKKSEAVNKKSGRSFRFSTSRHLLLPSKHRFSLKKGGGNNRQQSTKSSSLKMTTATYVEQPRTHSVKGISRAKIKTIKLTVTIICCYIVCSSPFIGAQLWLVYDPNSYTSTFFTGPTFTILTLLASLNSCVNPYIFLFFNPNLLENCFRGIFRPKFPTRRFNNNSALSSTLSQNRKSQLGIGRSTSTAATVTSNGVKYSYRP